MTTLQAYFKLQYTLIKRHLTDFGVNPLLGLFIIAAGFTGISFYLFSKTEYAVYLYILLALSLVCKLSDTTRNEFSKGDYTVIRILENVFLIIPFIIFMAFEKELYPIMAVIACSVLLAFIQFNRSSSFTIPTPFSKKPFEFTEGFRKWFLMFLFLYFITVMSVVYQNFNLGIFSLLAVFFICLSFYSEPEKDFFVWIHNQKAAAFLAEKIKTAIIFSTLLCLPVFLALLIFFPAHTLVIIAFQLLGYCYLVAVIFAKYAAYPGIINLPEGILLSAGIIAPPLLAAIIPYFYARSVRTLRLILG